MVGADQDLAAAVAVHKFVGAMLADIVEGPDLTIAAANAEQPLPRDLEREVVAWRRQLRDVARILPGAGEQIVPLGLEDRWIGIVASFEGPCRTGLDLGRGRRGGWAHSFLLRSSW